MAVKEKTIYEKLATVQRELVAPKGQYNSFGKYSYRSCEDILKALKPICDAEECVVYISNDLECIGDRNYVKATVEFIDTKTGEKITSTAHAREEETKKGMDGSQITGASSSYARKYALSGLFAIDNEKDSDATNKGEQAPAPKTSDSLTEVEVDAIRALLKKNGIAEGYILKSYKLQRLEDASKKQYANIANNIGKIKAAQDKEEI